MELTWIDITILAILLFYSIEGYALGAFASLLDLLQFAGSFFLAFKFYGMIAGYFTYQFSLPGGIANALGFFVVAFISELILAVLLKRFFRDMMANNFLQKPDLRTYNRVLGILPGLLSGLVLVMFVITIVASLPLSPFFRKALANGKVSAILLARSQLIEKQVNKIFGSAAIDTINFLTVEPESNAMVNLHFTDKNGTLDVESENQMFLMVNDERKKVGVPALVMSNSLQNVAREHAQDMLTKGYFSHYTPAGLSPFDRMNLAGIIYTAAGENLAFSPNLTLAMQGLMQSPGHRANILSKDFGKVGIGVVDAGIYGEMFVQEFTN